jgi:phosphatidylglycerophosphate synthase
MPSVYDLKPRFQARLRPLMRQLAAAGMTPNAVTVLALLGSVAAGVALAFAGRHPALLLVLPVWLFARMALNAIDGMMAREMNMASTLGAVLNEFGDVASDLALYLPLAFVTPAAQWPVIAFAAGAVLTEFCGVLARALGASRRYDGPMGKSDRAFIVGALALLTFAVPALLPAWPWVFAVAAALTALTCLNRLRRALGELRVERAPA